MAQLFSLGHITHHKNMNTQTTESRMARYIKAKNKYMSIWLRSLLIMFLLFTGIYQVSGQGTQYFRITGPAATKITAFRPDGTLVWTNALARTNYTIETVSSLPGGTNWVSYVRIAVTNRVNTNQIISFSPPAGMSLIPAGSFTIGDTLDGEIYAIPTNVTISSFFMDMNLVSYSQWQSVYNWATTHGYGFDNAGAGKATNHPVQTVSWYDVVKWCNARSQQAGLTPVYFKNIGLTQVYTNGDTDAVYPNWAANGYRLPTEAEWEKAARGGLIGQRFPWGDTISWSQANYYGDPLSLDPNNGFAYDLVTAISCDPVFASGANPYTSPVGSFAPNGYGLYDMAGNVFEWCWDWFALPPYPSGSPYMGGTDPHGPASSPSGYRVLRGGDWDADAYDERCAYRHHAGTTPNAALNLTGFRCVRGF